MTSGENSIKNHDFEFAMQQVEQAARGQHAAWALSGAMCTIERCASGRALQLTVGQAQQLSSAIEGAHRAVGGLFRETGARDVLDVGIGALRAQVELWALDPPVRSSARYDGLAPFEIARFARILRNGLHSHSLVEMIDEQAKKRGRALPWPHSVIALGATRGPRWFPR